MPLRGEFEEGLGEWCDELIVYVKPVVHAVVSDERLLCLDHSLDN